MSPNVCQLCPRSVHSREGLESQNAVRLATLAALARAKDEKIVILNEVKNLVYLVLRRWILWQDPSVPSG